MSIYHIFRPKASIYIEFAATNHFLIKKLDGSWTTNRDENLIKIIGVFRIADRQYRVESETFHPKDLEEKKDKIVPDLIELTKNFTEKYEPSKT